MTTPPSASAAREVIRRLEAQLRLSDMGYSERFEYHADRFYRETGLMAPGKSVPPEMAGGDYQERREAAWEQWNVKLKEEWKATLREARALLAQQEEEIAKHQREENEQPEWWSRRLHAVVVGALRHSVNDHGPSLADANLGSAAKRVASAIAGFVRTRNNGDWRARAERAESQLSALQSRLEAAEARERLYENAQCIRCAAHLDAEAERSTTDAALALIREAARDPKLSDLAVRAIAAGPQEPTQDDIAWAADQLRALRQSGGSQETGR